MAPVSIEKMKKAKPIVLMRRLHSYMNIYVSYIISRDLITKLFPD